MKTKTIQQEIFETFQNSITLPNTQSLVEWCKHNVYLPNPPYSISGYFDASKSPYMIEPLRALENDAVREVVICGNPRGGKTLIAEAYLLYTLMENPADIWFAVHKSESIKGIMDTRLLPLFDSNYKRIHFTDDRFQKTQQFIKFAVGSLKLVGAQNANSMTQTSGRVLIGDEIHLWSDGVLDQFRTRADDFPNSKKILLISQASEENKDFHKAYLAGQQSEFGFKCPHCGFTQKYLFSYKFHDGKYGGLNWDSNTVTKPNGQWDIEQASRTVNYTCTNPDCRHRFFDNAKERRLLNDNGCYIETNPGAPSHIRSYSWNALATPNISYSTLCKEYLTSKSEYERGRYAPIKNFWLQRMSKFFTVGKSEDMSQGTISDIDSDVSGSFAGEIVMGVDSQLNGSHPYVICRFDTDKKEMQLVTYGTATTFEEIEKIRVDNRVKTRRVICDCRYQQSDSVYLEIAKHRVKGTKGDGTPVTYSWIGAFGVGNRRGGNWYHGKDKRTGTEINKPYSPIKRIPIKFGTKEMIKGFLCPTISYDDPTIKDVLDTLLKNKHPQWRLIISPETLADKNFMSQINSEKKVCKVDKNGYSKWMWVKSNADNDMFDCCKLCVLYGMTMGFL